MLIDYSIVEDKPIEEETTNKVAEKEDSNDVGDSIWMEGSNSIEWIVEEEKEKGEECSKLLFYDPKSELEFPHFEIEYECRNGRKC